MHIYVNTVVSLLCINYIQVIYKCPHYLEGFIYIKMKPSKSTVLKAEKKYLRQNSACLQHAKNEDNKSMSTNLLVYTRDKPFRSFVQLQINDNENLFTAVSPPLFIILPGFLKQIQIDPVNSCFTNPFSSTSLATE